MKLKKLNNKGMTAVEILVTFVIMVVIVVSMYDSIMNLKNKETVASYRNSLVTYKNLLTKEIQDDLIKVGLIAARIDVLKEGGVDVGYKIFLTLRDGSKRVLEIKQVIGCHVVEDIPVEDCSESNCSMVYHECTKLGIPANRSDDFRISYGPEGNVVEYPLPNLGSSEVMYGTDSSTKHKIYDLRINEVNVSISNDILSIYVGLYHYDLGTQYSIDIVSPINYQ